jgi:hypothetical protein
MREIFEPAGRTWRLPVTVMVLLAALCAFGSAVVLGLGRWLWRGCAAKEQGLPGPALDLSPPRGPAVR